MNFYQIQKLYCINSYLLFIALEFKKDKKKPSIHSFMINNLKLQRLGSLDWGSSQQLGFSKLNYFEYRFVNDFDATFFEIIENNRIKRLKIADNTFFLPIDFQIELTLFDYLNHILEVPCKINIIPNLKKTSWHDLADRIDYIIVSFEMEDILFYDCFSVKKQLIPFFMCTRARVYHREKNYNLIITGKQEFEKIYYCVLCA